MFRSRIIIHNLPFSHSDLLPQLLFYSVTCSECENIQFKYVPPTKTPQRVFYLFFQITGGHDLCAQGKMLLYKLDTAVSFETAATCSETAIVQLSFKHCACIIIS
uniref:Uncharacterized protein n=1 Tax=Sipha flava TaxID=143950 RepID=A0A2S2Q304_9HEMI